MTGGEGLSVDLQSGRGLHTFLCHLDSGLDPVPWLDPLVFLGIDPYGMVHLLLHSFLSVLVVTYAADRRLLDFIVNLPPEGIPTVM